MRAKLRSILSSLFGWAISKRRVTVNPAKKSGIRATREERMDSAPSVQRCLTAAELPRLADEVPERYRAMVRLMAHVGLRPGACRFNDDAVSVAGEPGKPPVELVNADRLTDLALEYGVGVRSESVEAFTEDLDAVFSDEIEGS